MTTNNLVLTAHADAITRVRTKPNASICGALLPSASFPPHLFIFVSCREGKSHPGNKRWMNSSDKMKKAKIGSANRGSEPHSGDGMGQIASLERLHEQSDVHGSLKMQKGHRLKLDPIRGNQKQETKAMFEIQFTEVDVPVRTNDATTEDSPDHDEFPSIEQLLTGKRQASLKAPPTEIAQLGILSVSQVQKRQELPSPRKRRRIASIREKTVSAEIFVALGTLVGNNSVSGRGVTVSQNRRIIKTFRSC